MITKAPNRLISFRFRVPSEVKMHHPPRPTVARLLVSVSSINSSNVNNHNYVENNSKVKQPKSKLVEVLARNNIAVVVFLDLCYKLVVGNAPVELMIQHE